ncbi:uncharacterized protein LOC124819088 [Hydra vulgaris]|uniref:uncharacterized protein LOC124819088 n=1 Tax=Hydra vulgaris TaxID=6087 RepID=UPI001F5F4A5A|nr:MFS-type transporter clz9-like [Hydra vulgaris]
MTSGDRGYSITMIGVINAGGGYMLPMLIFLRKKFKDFMLKGATEGTLGGANPSGWSNEDLFLGFLKHFVKHTRLSKENPSILLLDNNESQISIPTIHLAKYNGITMVTFHLHISHKMQPLGRGVFGPFKTYYNNKMRNWMLKPGNTGKPASIYNVSEIVGQAFLLAFTPNNITHSFLVSGLHPLNKNIFKDYEFLPSTITDRPQPVSEDQPGNKSKHIEDFLSRSRPSTNTDVTSCSLASFTNQINANILSPDIILPYPKAQPRKQTGKGRPKKKSCILTSSHVTLQIKKEKAKIKKKSCNKMKRKTDNKQPEPVLKKKAEFYLGTKYRIRGKCRFSIG